MSSHPAIARAGSILVVAACLSSPASAQFVPVRELDFNQLFTTHPGIPKEVVGGTAAGWAMGSTETAVVWDPVVGSNPLTPLPGRNHAEARGLNRAGTVVGVCWNNALTQFATRWIGGTARNLSLLVTGGSTMALTYASDVDERDRIVGRGFDANTGLYRAWHFDQGFVTDLGALGSTEHSDVFRMNDYGMACGLSTTGSGAGPAHACRFDLANGVLDLHDATLMGTNPSTALDIARDGRVVGWHGTFLAPKAFLWDGAKVVDLTTLVPGRNWAYGMNDFGDIVGSYDMLTWTTFAPSAYLIHDGVFVDLNTLIDPALGWWLGFAMDIDDEGRIVGWGTHNSVTEAFILEPVCNGTFTIYGHGCPGGAGREPRLVGTGRPTPDQDFAIQVLDGPSAGLGFAFLGTGTGSFPIKPGCDLQVLPLVPPLIPIVLDSLGELWLPTRLPLGTPTFDLNLQAFLFDAYAPYGISATKPLALHFQ